MIREREVQRQWSKTFLTTCGTIISMPSYFLAASDELVGEGGVFRRRATHPKTAMKPRTGHELAAGVVVGAAIVIGIATCACC